MTTFIVPPVDAEPWPTLGPEVCWFIEEYLVHGPGDVRGEPIKLNPEQAWAIYRMYEVYPQDDARAGRRRFKRCAISWRKGTAKTEFLALLAAVELHPDGPVRCRGFDGQGEPIGGSVDDPYIPLIAYTEEQSDELAYAALKAILEESSLAGDFDIGLERIMRRDGRGRAVSLAGAPNARDGARTTFQGFDETHRYTLPSLKRAHQTMQRNIPKRYMADPWSLETTTAYAPGENSIAEDTFEYARTIEAGTIEEPHLFFFHRQAGDEHDLSTQEGRRAAVLEASGPYFAEWSDIDSIVDEWDDPKADTAYLERVWTNRPVQYALRAFDLEAWGELSRPDEPIADGEQVTVGLAGARYSDSTAVVVTGVESGHQMLAGIWEAPSPKRESYEVPDAELDGVVASTFERWNVWRLYGMAGAWDSWMSEWAGRYGSRRIVEKRPNQVLAMAYATRAFSTAVRAGEVTNDGSEPFKRQIGNALRRYQRYWDEQDEQLWTLQKERDDSPFAIDIARAAVLSWEARGDAIASGPPDKPKKKRAPTTSLHI